MDRQTAATHLAKVFAFLACGKTAAAQLHARILIAWLQAI
jgi:hypothetical protein